MGAWLLKRTGYLTRGQKVDCPVCGRRTIFVRYYDGEGSRAQRYGALYIHDVDYSRWVSRVRRSCFVGRNRAKRLVKGE